MCAWRSKAMGRGEACTNTVPVHFVFYFIPIFNQNAAQQPGKLYFSLQVVVAPGAMCPILRNEHCATENTALLWYRPSLSSLEATCAATFFTVVKKIPLHRDCYTCWQLCHGEGYMACVLIIFRLKQVGKKALPFLSSRLQPAMSAGCLPSPVRRPHAQRIRIFSACVYPVFSIFEEME